MLALLPPPLRRALGLSDLDGDRRARAAVLRVAGAVAPVLRGRCAVLQASFPDPRTQDPCWDLGEIQWNPLGGARLVPPAVHTLSADDVRQIEAALRLDADLRAAIATDAPLLGLLHSSDEADRRAWDLWIGPATARDECFGPVGEILIQAFSKSRRDPRLHRTHGTRVRITETSVDLFEHDRLP